MPVVLVVVCPYSGCGRRNKVQSIHLGREIVCKRCGKSFRAEHPGGEIPATGNASSKHTIRLEEKNIALSNSKQMPGQISRFQIRSQLGKGAFGTVYLAHDPILDRDVALKVPRASVLASPKARTRFLREPKAAAQLRHPHIVPVYDAGIDGDDYYIAAAYIEGRTLQQHIDHEPITFHQAAKIVHDLALALNYAHELGVIHRDVKPGNIMIDSRGEAMLMDFGLARLKMAEEETLTQDGVLLGTPAYMAPEQADSSFGEVISATDQYGLGVVLYELLCGQTPFSGPPSVLLFNTINTAAEPPQKKNAQVPRDLETICLKSINKRPEDRYHDCGEMAEDLRRWLADEPISARRLGPTERMSRWCRKNPALAGLSVVAGLLLILITVVATWAYIRELDLRRNTEATLAIAQDARNKETEAD